MPSNPSNVAQPGFPIGVVCRMTGIAQETLRAWERRYSLVTPSRAGGRNRLYSPDDVKRITVVKALVDAGHPIGSVAALDEAQLETLHAAVATTPRAANAPVRSAAPGARGPGRVAVVGRALATRLVGSTGGPTFDDAVVIDALGDLSPDRRFDVLVVEMPTIHADGAGALGQALKQSGARAAVVVYEFGARGAVAALEALGAVCMKGPIDPSAVDRAVQALLASGAFGGEAPAGIPTSPRFSADQLARIVARAPAIACECPRHLANLIGSLVAFERFSEECQHRNAEDAHIHRDLQRMAVSARAMVEASLERVLAFEGFSADED